MNMRPLLLSLKPHYADLVFRGLKTAELRRRIPCVENRDVFVYVSSPIRQLRGGFRVEHVWSGSPEQVWEEVSEFARVEKQDFDAYYAGRTVAYALGIADVWEHERPVGLEGLRDRFLDFVVPQSWRYVKQEEYRYFQTLKRNPIQYEGSAQREDSVRQDVHACTWERATRAVTNAGRSGTIG